LFEEDSFSIFALEIGEKFSGMRIRRHDVLIVGVNEFDTFGDELGIFHLRIYIVTA
jgi:hypothetical protein